MEKDYRTGKQARRSEEGERASEQRAQEKDANAARLAALLDAARRQEEKTSAEPGKSLPGKKSSPIDRALAAPASYVTEDVHAARVRATHPDLGAAPVADSVMPPPLVDRDLDGNKISSGRVILRLLLVAILFGAAIYAFVHPASKEDAVSAADTPGAAPDAVPVPTLATPDRKTEPAGAVDTAATEAPPAATAEAVVPAEPPVKPIAKSAAAADAPPVVKTSSLLVPASHPSPAATADDAARVGKAPADEPSSPANEPSSKEPVTTAKPAMPKAADADAVAPVAVSAPLRRAVDIPPPPPPPPSPVLQSSADTAPAAAKTPGKAKPDLTIGEATLRALSLIGPDAASINPSETRTVVRDRSSTRDYPPTAPADSRVSGKTPDTAVSSDTATVKPVSARRPYVERRPYFERLGPPPPNPFRPNEIQPAPAAPESSFLYRYYDIE